MWDGEASVGSNSSPFSAVPKTTSGVITIPSILGGYPVTSIGDRAFVGCNSVLYEVVAKLVGRIVLNPP